MMTTERLTSKLSLNDRLNGESPTPSTNVVYSLQECCLHERLMPPEYRNEINNSKCTCRPFHYDQTCTSHLRKRTKKTSWFGGILKVSPPTTKTTFFQSLQFCLYSFIIWTLIIGPLLFHYTKDITFFHRRISAGSVLLVGACHPGSTNGGGSRPRPNVNLTPFQRDEFIPKMSEQTIGASGPAEGAIHKDSRRYHDELSPNWNPDIVFRDEEHTNEDRMMTKRCMDRLNVLAVWVANQWSGIKLRVTEAWDDPDTEHIHPEDSLHYEGRAVDITTSDLDRSKYPILARLAVEAGFDWVEYKKNHVHCSVRSDSSDAALRGGCFSGDSIVHCPGGITKKIKDLQPGDTIFSVDFNGKVQPDTLLTFMDVKSDVYADKQVNRAFVSLTVEGGSVLQLTRNHLVYTSKNLPGFAPNSRQPKQSILNPFYAVHNLSTAIFAGNVEVGDYVFATANFKTSHLSANTTMRWRRVTEVKYVTSASGAYAPLTTSGTIVVNGVVASSYAVIENEYIAHAVMTPVRYYYLSKFLLSSWFSNTFLTGDNDDASRDTFQECKLTRHAEGMSLYTKILYDIGLILIPEWMFWGD